MIKFTFLSENKTENPCFTAEHGLSIYIDVNGRQLLFDTGSSELFIKNAKNMNLDLTEIEAVVISHGHFDHTQGLPFFCKINKKAKIYIHRNGFKKSYGMEDGKLDKEQCGILWTENEKREMEDRFIYTENRVEISEDIVVSGTIPNSYGCNMSEMFYNEDETGKLSADDMSHEQFLVIRDRDEDGYSPGIYIFSGCSHKGILAPIKYAKELFPGEKILGLIAGMHLYRASHQSIEKLLDEISGHEIEMVMPVHCTGVTAICQLKSSLGDICWIPTVGNSYEF